MTAGLAAEGDGDYATPYSKQAAGPVLAPSHTKRLQTFVKGQKGGKSSQVIESKGNIYAVNMSQVVYAMSYTISIEDKYWRAFQEQQVPPLRFPFPSGMRSFGRNDKPWT
jgi:hypothetical protein